MKRPTKRAAAAREHFRHGSPGDVWVATMVVASA